MAEAPRTRGGRARPSRAPRSSATGARPGVTRDTAKAAPSGRIRRGATRASTSAGDSLRITRMHQVAEATSGMLGVSSTRRAAILALVVCALALTVAVPLRNFLTQRDELARLEQQQAFATRQLADLNRQRDQLRDPAYVAAQARERLGYVKSGEIPYVVQLPGDAGAPETALAPGGPVPWFDRLWSDVRGISR